MFRMNECQLPLSSVSVSFLLLLSQKYFLLTYFYVQGAYHIKKQSSRVSCKKDVLKNFTKFPGKDLCVSLFFNKVAVLRPGTLLKKSLWYRCFPVNFAKFLITHFLTEHLWWLFLNVTLS